MTPPTRILFKHVHGPCSVQGTASNNSLIHLTLRVSFADEDTYPGIASKVSHGTHRVFWLLRHSSSSGLAQESSPNNGMEAEGWGWQLLREATRGSLDGTPVTKLSFNQLPTILT